MCTKNKVMCTVETSFSLTTKYNRYHANGKYFKVHASAIQKKWEVHASAIHTIKYMQVQIHTIKYMQVQYRRNGK